MLKSASFAKSVVGRTLKFFGADILLDFHRPDMILYMFCVGCRVRGVGCWELSVGCEVRGVRCGCRVTDVMLLLIYNIIIYF